MSKKKSDVKYTDKPSYRKVKVSQQKVRSILYNTLKSSGIGINPDQDMEDALQEIAANHPDIATEYMNNITDLNVEQTIYLATNLEYEDILELTCEEVEDIYAKSVETLDGNAIDFLKHWVEFTTRKVESHPVQKTQ